MICGGLVRKSWLVFGYSVVSAGCMKIKPVFVGIAVLGVLLLLLSLSTVAKVLRASPRSVLAGVKAQPLAVNLLPKRSPAFISFLVNPDKLGLFTQLAAQPSDRANVRHELDNLKQQLRQNWLLDYERDVKTWLDQEITLAVTDLDLDNQPANGLQSGYLLAFVAKDVDLAKTTIADFWQRLALNGSDLGFEQYQGVSILSTSVINDKPAIAGTTLGKFVLFANDPKVLREVINDLQSPSLALTSLDSYRDRIAQIDTGKIAIAYVNLGELGEEIPKESLLMSLSVDKAGIRAKTLLALENSKLESIAESIDRKLTKPKSSQKSTANIAKAIPSASSVIIGNNLGQTLQSLQNSLSPEWQKAITKAILGNTDIQFDRNALAWAQDDYAIALLPKPNSDPDWLLVAKVKDAKNSETAIAALDDLARTKLTVGDISLKAQPIKVWTKLTAIPSSSNLSVSGTVVAAHALTPNYIYLSNSLTVLESALTLQDKQAIANSKTFKTITAKLSSDRQTYGYIDKNFDLSWLKTSLPILLPNKDGTNKISQTIGSFPLQQILKHLDIVSFASTSNKANIENGELFLLLK